jgi:hypothetical protein
MENPRQEKSGEVSLSLDVKEVEKVSGERSWVVGIERGLED